MRNILKLIFKDIRKRSKSPWGIIILLSIPIVMTSIFGSIFSSSEDKMPKIKLLISDKDDSPASGFLKGMLGNQHLRDKFTISFVKEQEGIELIESNKASGLLVIPEGFQDNLINNRKTSFKLLKNPSEKFLPQIIEEFMETVSVMVSGLTTIFAEEIQMLKDNPDISLENLDLNLILPQLKTLKNKIVNFKKYLDPLLIELQSEVPQKETSKVKNQNMFQFFLPAISIMFVLFFVEVFLRDILVEKEDGTLSRIMLTTVSPEEYILSKVLTAIIMGIFAQTLIFTSGILLFGIDWGPPHLRIPLTISSAIYIASLFTLINALCKTKNQAAAITSPVILIFAALGGSMLPYQFLPDIMKSISPVTVNYWYIEGMRQIMAGEPSLTSSLVLLSEGIIFLLVAFKILPRRISS